MNSPAYQFDPPPVVSVPVRGFSPFFPVRRIFCVSRNYAAHAKEIEAEVDREAPWYFNKSRDAVALSGSTISYPPGTENLHHEMEMVVALGAEAFDIKVEHALDVVFGYACGVDLTRRDLQNAATQKNLPWDFAKDFEQAAVISAITTVEECGHPASGKIQLAVNDEIKQSSNLSQMIWPVPALISYLSRYYHLRPGDLIFTGTPEGVGALKAGDHVTGCIEGIGSLELSIAD